MRSAAMSVGPEPANGSSTVPAARGCRLDQFLQQRHRLRGGVFALHDDAETPGRKGALSEGQRLAGHRPW